MSDLGRDSQPLRVAVIGSGPTGFYVVMHLFREKELAVTVDLYDRLPTPFGLVRGGVAPDHPKAKSVTRAYDKIAQDERFRFFGNVEIGKHLTVKDLERHYHAVVYCTGAHTDRRMGIPGEDLEGSHTATEFVAWYNGHPDYSEHEFDLSGESAVVVGVGNVAVDVARILCRTHGTLSTTDIADHALAQLEGSCIRDVYMLGRRGVAQAAFSNAEVKELGHLTDAVTRVPKAEVELDPLSAAAIENDKTARTKVDLVQQFASDERSASKTLHMRFLVSPVEILGDDKGHVRGVRIVKNRLVQEDDGWIRPEPTDEFEEIPTRLVFRSVGYRGSPVPGVPFDDRKAVIPNENGRVLDGEKQLVGHYTAGWIKRGPRGVIGTNKPDALETVKCLLEDMRDGTLGHPEAADPSAAEAMVRAAQPDFFSYSDWKKVDAAEVSRGEEQGRPRVKLTNVVEMVQVKNR